MQIIPASNIACPWRVKTVELCTGWFRKGVSFLADFLKPRLSESHTANNSVQHTKDMLKYTPSGRQNLNRPNWRNRSEGMVCGFVFESTRRDIGKRRNSMSACSSRFSVEIHPPVACVGGARVSNRWVFVLLTWNGQAECQCRAA